VRRASLVVGFLLLAACDKGKPAPGAPGGPAGVISFVEGGQLRELDLATSKVTAVRPGRDPMRSPATREDVFILEEKKLCGKEPDDRCVMVAGTDGKAVVAVRSCKGCELPSLSPDGTLFAYAGYCREKLCGNSSHASFLRDRKGRIVHVFPSLGSPTWSADGRLLLAGDSLQGRVGIFLAPDHLKEARLDANLADPKELAISPDGKTIAFKQSGADNQIYTVGFDGQNPKKITELGEHTASWPAFSPDGKWLVIQDKERSWQDGTLALVPAAGGAVTPLLDDKKQPIKAGGRMQWR